MTATVTEEKPLLFSNYDLKNLILPLIGEQFLAMALGIADTIMVAYVGDAAIASTSLVNIIANLIIQLLAALCTGGAVVVSQYLGRNDLQNSRNAASQLVLLSISLMVFCTILILLFRHPLLRYAFGAIEEDVMSYSQIYLLITTFSFPFLAAYNAAAAIFRSMGNSRVSLNISILMNIINIGGNAFLIYVMKWGVAGAAVSTLVSRIVAAIIVIVMLRNPYLPIFVTDYHKIRPDWGILRSIFRIGIPNGIENSLFHFGKLIVQMMIVGLGTAAITANAVLNSVSSVMLVPGSAVSFALITVVGQCMGAGLHHQAQHYTKKLMKLTIFCIAVSNLPLLFLGRPLMSLFNLSAEATKIVLFLLPMVVFSNILLWPMSFTFPNTLRASGDVRVPMIVSFASMWVIRVGLSYIFVQVFHLGVVGVWYSMFLDWAVRIVCFTLRYKGGKWLTMKVIG